jgi:hypothetical protein
MIPEPNQPDRRPVIGFVAGTPILTADGYKPIEQLRPGDMIQARPAGEVCGVFVTCKPILLLHLNGQVIRTTADHPLYVEGKGWVNAGDLPGAQSNGEQVVYNLGGEPAMPDQPRPNFPILGFVAGTPILTADGPKRIEDIKPGDLIQTQPDDDHADDKPEAHHDEPRWWESN